MRRLRPALAATTLAVLLPAAASSQARHYPLKTTAGLRLHHVTAAPVTYEGKRGLRLTMSEDAQRRVAGRPVEEQGQLEELAVIEGTDFANGVIEAEIAGAPAPGAARGSRR